MEALKLYISLIEPRLLRHVKGKPGRFIAVLREESYLNEEAFKQRICGEKNGASYYRTLKSRTLKILQALTIVSSPQGRSLVKKNYDNCQKFFLMGRKLLSQGEREEGLRLVKRAYNIAVEYDLVYEACELSSILYHDHIYYHPSKKQANFYAQQVKEYLNDYSAEKNAEHYFYQVLSEMNRSTDPEKIQNAIKGLDQEVGRSIKYSVYKTTLEVLYGFRVGDYERIVAHCNQTLKGFEQKKGV